MDELRLGIAGAGRIGRVHAANVAQMCGVRLVAVADPCADRAMAAAQAHGGEAGTDAHALVRRADVDAVLVCSSTDTHAELIEAAAASGKAVFCEKPLDAESGRIARLLDRVRAAGVVLQAGFNRRFDAGFARLASGVRAGEVGRFEMLRITSRDPAPPPLEYVRVSGGLFSDMMIHDFDLARFFSGDEIVEVYAAGAALVDPAIGAAGDVDSAIVQLRFAGGALGVIENSRRAAYGYDQRAEVLGSAGCLTAANVAEDGVQRWDANGCTAARPLHFFLERYAAAYRSELEAFVACVRDGAPVPCSGQDALQATRIAEAARRSWIEKRPVAVEVS